MAIRRERFDLGEELAPPYETPEGFLVVEAYVSRPGIYVYRNTREDELDGLGKEGELRRELRPDSEVTSPKSLETYRARSVTVGHPRKNGKRVRVDANNVREFEVGTVDGPARVVNGRLAAKLVIKDKAAIAEAKARKRQVSPGHLSEIIVQKGVDPKYGRYDAIQADIEINHIALVERARGGDSLHLRLDGEELREDSADNGKLTTTVEGHAHLVRLTDWEGHACSSGTTSWAVSEGEDHGHEHAWVKNADGTITIAASSGHTHEIVQESPLGTLLDLAGAPLDAAGFPPVAPLRTDGTHHSFRSDEMADKKSREDELTEKVQELEGVIKSLEKERDTLEGRVRERMDAAEAEAVRKAVERADEAEKRLDAYKAGFTQAVKSWTALTVVAQAVLGKGYRMDDKDEANVVADVVKRLDPAIDVVNTPLPELRGHFKQLVARFDRAKKEYADAADTIGSGSRSRADEEARSRKIDDEWNNQWKRPAASTLMLQKER